MKMQAIFNMKKIKITCDGCKQEIDIKCLYGLLKLPMLEELNFCGIGCFDDWIKHIYLKFRIVPIDTSL